MNVNILFYCVCILFDSHLGEKILPSLLFFMSHPFLLISFRSSSSQPPVPEAVTGMKVTISSYSFNLRSYCCCCGVVAFVLLWFCAFVLLLIHHGLAMGGYTGSDVNGDMAQRRNQTEVMAVQGSRCSAAVRDVTVGAAAFWWNNESGSGEGGWSCVWVKIPLICCVLLLPLCCSFWLCVTSVC